MERISVPLFFFLKLGGREEETNRMTRKQYFNRVILWNKWIFCTSRMED